MENCMHLIPIKGEISKHETPSAKIKYTQDETVKFSGHSLSWLGTDTLFGQLRERASPRRKH